MRTIIIGGTGMLGTAVAGRLVAAGHPVTVVGRAANTPLPGTTVVVADVSTLDAAGLRALAAGHDALVYALGPDDRSSIDPPADAFFAEHLVGRTERVLTAAREAGVTAAVVLSSYFATRARTDPGFAARHVYVAARVAQGERAIAAGGETVRVSVLEIPYVFGMPPGMRSQWRAMYYQPSRFAPVVPYPGGSTTAATSATVADAAGAALERGRHGARYPVGDGDMTFAWFFDRFLRALGRTSRTVPLPRPVADLVGLAAVAWLALRRESSGLDMRSVMGDVMYADHLVDHAATRAELGLVARDLGEAIDADVRHSYPHLR